MKATLCLAKDRVRSTSSQKGAVLRATTNLYTQPIVKRFAKQGSAGYKEAVKAKENNPSRLSNMIEGRNRVDQSTNRESVESRMSAILRRQLLEDTTNSSDERRGLKLKNRELIQENKQLRKRIDLMCKGGSMANSNQLLSSFQFADLMEDSDSLSIKRRSKKQQGQADFRTQGPRINSDSFNRIQQLYWQAFRNAKTTGIEPLTQAIRQYARYYQDLFVKINFLVGRVEANPQDPNLKYLRETVLTMKLPILYKDNHPAIVKLLQFGCGSWKGLPGRSKPRPMREDRVVDAFVPQLLSPAETLKVLQKLLQKVTKSSSMIAALSNKSGIVKLVRRLNQEL